MYNACTSIFCNKVTWYNSKAIALISLASFLEILEERFVLFPNQLRTFYLFQNFVFLHVVLFHHILEPALSHDIDLIFLLVNNFAIDKVRVDCTGQV